MWLLWTSVSKLCDRVKAFTTVVFRCSPRGTLTMHWHFDPLKQFLPHFFFGTGKELVFFYLLLPTTREQLNNDLCVLLQYARHKRINLMVSLRSLDLLCTGGAEQCKARATPDGLGRWSNHAHVLDGETPGRLWKANKWQTLKALHWLDGGSVRDYIV